MPGSVRACVLAYVPFSPVGVQLSRLQKCRGTGGAAASVGGEARFRSGPGELGACAGHGTAGGEWAPGPLAGPSHADGAGPREEAPLGRVPIPRV